MNRKVLKKNLIFSRKQSESSFQKNNNNYILSKQLDF